MESILDWLQQNKEWVFSGAGVTIAAAIVGLLVSAMTSGAHKRRPPALQLNLAFGHLTYEGPPYLRNQMLLFTVTNPSDRVTQLSSIRLPLRNASNMVFPHLNDE